MDRARFEAAAKQLMAVPLAEFVGRRKELARELRDSGEADTATVILKTRKPALSVWTANQVARQDPEAIEVLLRAAVELETVQAAALSGTARSADEMRSASAAFQQALDRTLKRGSRLEVKSLSSEGSRRPVRDLLAAASLGPADSRAALAEGRLLEEPPPIGFGGLTVSEQGAPGAKSTGRSSARADVDAARQSRVREQARKRAKRAEDDASRAEAHASRLEAEADRAETEARRLRRGADAARSRATEKRDQARASADEPGMKG